MRRGRRQPARTAMRAMYSQRDNDARVRPIGLRLLGAAGALLAALVLLPSGVEESGLAAAAADTPTVEPSKGPPPSPTFPFPPQPPTPVQPTWTSTPPPTPTATPDPGCDEYTVATSSRQATLAPGGSAGASILVSGGLTNRWRFQATDVPPSLSVAFNPDSAMGNGTSLLQVTAAADAAPGTHEFQVVVVCNGAQVAQFAFSVTIVAAAAPRAADSPPAAGPPSAAGGASEAPAGPPPGPTAASPPGPGPTASGPEAADGPPPSAAPEPEAISPPVPAQTSAEPSAASAATGTGGGAPGSGVTSARSAPPASSGDYLSSVISSTDQRWSLTLSAATSGAIALFLLGTRRRRSLFRLGLVALLIKPYAMERYPEPRRAGGHHPDPERSVRAKAGGGTATTETGLCLYPIICPNCEEAFGACLGSAGHAGMHGPLLPHDCPAVMSCPAPWCNLGVACNQLCGHAGPHNAVEPHKCIGIASCPTCRAGCACNKDCPHDGPHGLLEHTCSALVRCPRGDVTTVCGLDCPHSGSHRLLEHACKRITSCPGCGSGMMCSNDCGHPGAHSHIDHDCRVLLRCTDCDTVYRCGMPCPHAGAHGSGGGHVCNPE